MKEGSCWDMHECTDSKLLFTVLQSMTTKLKLILEYRNTLNGPIEERAGEWFWNSGFRGHKCNNTADHLTKLGAGQLMVDSEPTVGISDEQIKEHFLLWKGEKKKEVFVMVKGCRQDKVFIGKELSNR